MTLASEFRIATTHVVHALEYIHSNDSTFAVQLASMVGQHSAGARAVCHVVRIELSTMINTFSYLEARRLGKTIRSNYVEKIEQMAQHPSPS